MTDKTKEQLAEEKPAFLKDKKDKDAKGAKAEADDKDEADKDDDVEVDTKKDKKDVKEETTVKKVRLLQAYRQEDQPPVETVGEKDPLKGVKGTVKESIGKVFDGENLTEDFKAKASTVFEAVVTSYLTEETEKIEEAAQIALDERMTAYEAELNEKVDEYLDYVVTEWLEQNQVGIESGLRSEISEDFITDLKALFESHNINIPAEKVDLLDEANAKVEALTAQVNTLTESAIEHNKIVFDLQKADALKVMSEGLADTQKEKLKKLIEGVEVKDLESFKEKAKILKESLFKEEAPKAPQSPAGETLAEGVDPLIQKYIEAGKALKAQE